MVLHQEIATICKLKRFFIFLPLLLLGLYSCRPVTEESIEEDRVLAKVYNKTLYLSEVKALVPPGLSDGDSLLRLNAIVEKWARDALLMHEAEKNISKDLNIDQLVRDYRASLIVHNFEKQLVEANVDSTVSRRELLDYYEKNKDQYILEKPVIRCFFIQFPKDLPEHNRIKNIWSKVPQDTTAFSALMRFSIESTQKVLLNDSSWYEIDQIVDIMPPNSYSVQMLSQGGNFQVTDESYHYWCKVFEYKEANEYPPLNFIEDQLKKVILHHEKIELLKETRDEIYEREIRRNNVHIYTN